MGKIQMLQMLIMRFGKQNRTSEKYSNKKIFRSVTVEKEKYYSAGHFWQREALWNIR